MTAPADPVWVDTGHQVLRSQLDPQVWVPYIDQHDCAGALCFMHPGGLRAVKAWVIDQLPAFTGRVRWVGTDNNTWTLQVTS